MRLFNIFKSHHERMFLKFIDVLEEFEKRHNLNLSYIQIKNGPITGTFFRIAFDRLAPYRMAPYQLKLPPQVSWKSAVLAGEAFDYLYNNIKITLHIKSETERQTDSIEVRFDLCKLKAAEKLKFDDILRTVFKSYPSDIFFCNYIRFGNDGSNLSDLIWSFTFSQKRNDLCRVLLALDSILCETIDEYCKCTLAATNNYPDISMEPELTKDLYITTNRMFDKCPKINAKTLILTGKNIHDILDEVQKEGGTLYFAFDSELKSSYYLLGHLEILHNCGIIKLVVVNNIPKTSKTFYQKILSRFVGEKL